MNLSLDINPDVLNPALLEELAAQCEANGGQTTIEITVKLHSTAKFVRAQKPKKIFEL